MGALLKFQKMKKFIKLIVIITLQFFLLGCNNQSSVKKKTQISLKGYTKTGSIININGLDLLKLQKLDKKTYIINVSKPNQNERQCKQIKNYHHLEASKIYKNSSLLPKDKTLILISKNGKVSLELANFLKNLGITVYNLDGGLKAYFEWKDFIETQHKIRPADDNIFDGLEETDFGC